jgi:carbapenam-3-carboxylate synthase
MRSGFLGSYGTEISGAERWLGIEVHTSSERSCGMTALVRYFDHALVCCYGDVLLPSSAPGDSDVESWLRWARSTMLRSCGALCWSDRLVLWTDEAALCPLFYAFDSAKQPLFATQAKTLADLIPGTPCFATSSRGRPLPNIGNTIFKGVRSVPPGVVLEFKRAKSGWYLSDSATYFKLPPPRITDFEEARALVKETLESSVRRATDVTDELGVTLSGGVDSGSVAAIATVAGRRLSSYTVGSSFGNEFETAAEVAALLGSRHHEMVMTLQNLQDLLPDLVRLLETWDPITLQIAAPMAFLYRHIAGRRMTLISGYGADLIFAGVADPSLPEKELERQILRQVQLTIPTNEFSPALAARYETTVRCPYWSPAMLIAGLSIRGRLKMRDGEVKHVLRCAAESWLPPNIAWRKKVGIHEGSSMHRMFNECLGTTTLGEQQVALHEIATRVLLEPQPAMISATEEVMPCVSF